MIKKRYKKGQFYLITVIILVSLFIAFISTFNFAAKERGIDIYEMKNEIEIETQKTMEYIAYNSLSDSEAKSILSDLADIYINKTGKDKNSFFIYGTSSELEMKGFKSDDENISISTNSGSYDDLNVNEGEYFGPRTYNTVENLTIRGEEVDTSFEIREGQSFYYLIHYKGSGGEYVVVHN
jgi:hypothetical protein